MGDWPQIRKYEIPPSEFYPISGDWGELRITKFDTNLSSKMLLNAAKCQGYNFYYFISYQGKTKRGKGKITPLQFAKNLPKDALIFGQLIECNMRNTWKIIYKMRWWN